VPLVVTETVVPLVVIFGVLDNWSIPKVLFAPGAVITLAVSYTQLRAHETG
jgi:hypothetical protein